MKLTIYKSCTVNIYAEGLRLKLCETLKFESEYMYGSLASSIVFVEFTLEFTVKIEKTVSIDVYN
jgi:hypothetical protein